MMLPHTGGETKRVPSLMRGYLFMRPFVFPMWSEGYPWMNKVLSTSQLASLERLGGLCFG